MKNFEQFLEATASSPKQVATAVQNPSSKEKKIERVREQQRRQNRRIQQGKVSAPAQTRAGKALPPGKPGGPLASSKGSKLATTQKDTPGALTTPKTKQRVASGSAGEPRLERDKAVSGTYNRGKGNKIIDARRRALDKLRDKQTSDKGFRSGLKQSMGGDLIAGAGKGKEGWNDPNNKAKRAAARQEKGKQFGNFVKSTPGKAVGLAGRALSRAAKTKMANTGIESGDGAGSYETKDTKI